MRNLSKSFIIIALFMFALRSEGYAQKKDRGPAVEIQKNSTSIEFGGNSIGFSVNYSRIILQEERTKLALRAGVGNMFTNNISIPFELTVMYGNKHHFEFGPGYRFGIAFDDDDDGEQSSTNEKYHSFTLRAGYRLQQPVGRSKVYASAGLVMNVTPGVSLFGEEGSPIVLPIPSAAIGVSF
ncbi:MAG: hypothetical protein GY751_10075 [Bacteroidetes bacterium]|nr:hypothetical protein [Bacteroidota bacterium]